MSMLPAVTAARAKLATSPTDIGAIIRLLSDIPATLEAAKSYDDAEKALRAALEEAQPVLQQIQSAEATAREMADALREREDKLRAAETILATDKKEWEELRGKEFAEIKQRKEMIAEAERVVSKKDHDIGQRELQVIDRENKVKTREDELDARAARYDNIERVLQGRVGDPVPA
jgi:chromosome segregation ATPase